MKALRLLVTALSVSLAGTTAALAAAGSASARGIDLVITVRSIETSTAPTDKAPPGPSKGDRFVIRDNLLNVAEQFGKRARAKVGTDIGTLTMTSKTEGLVVGTATLPGGRIRFHGVLHFRSAPENMPTRRASWSSVPARIRSTSITCGFPRRVRARSSECREGRRRQPAVGQERVSSSSMRWLPSVFGLTRSRSRNSATPSSKELRNSA
jgi:hypothetical protein